MDIENVYRLYFKDVFYYMVGISKDPQIAEEITQETFFKAIKYADTYDGTKDIRAWLFTIAKNSFYSECRKKKQTCQLDEEESSSSDVLEERLIDQENIRLIHCSLNKLPEIYQKVFSMRVFGELHFEQIGESFGKSSGWARVTFYRAKAKIISDMEDLEHGK